MGAPEVTLSKWNNLDLRGVDELNTLIPRAGFKFNLSVLKQTFLKPNQKPASFIKYLNGRNIAARHRLNELCRQGSFAPGVTRFANGWSKAFEQDGRWRLLVAIPDYANFDVAGRSRSILGQRTSIRRIY